MEIYDSRYFIFNKRFQMALGIWPYQSRVKNSITYAGLVLVMIIMLIPQFIRLNTYLGKDIEKTMENIFIFFYVFGIFVKLFTAHFAEDKLKILYESTAKNFETYTDAVEAEIMKRYSERGRLLTFVFLLYMISAVAVSVVLPMCPIILDSTDPLDQPRPRMFILNGEYIVDKYEYYFQIYTVDIISVFLMICILCATDPMYAAIVEHCLGLFSICKHVSLTFSCTRDLCELTREYRLRNFNKSCGLRMVEHAEAKRYGGDYAYAALVRAILLHKDIIKFTEIIQTSYSLYFLLEMGATIGILTSSSVVVVKLLVLQYIAKVVMKLKQPLELLRWSLFLFGVILHIFFLTWPGQKLIDFSSDIFQEAYLNDWYKSSLKCQNLLKFMSLRCSRPCELSGGGLYIMNFINFATILKTSASYITVFSSMFSSLHGDGYIHQESKAVMEIYDSKYFFFNKRFQQALGIWPYESRAKKKLMCGILVLIAIAVLVPQIARLSTSIGKDPEKTMENVVILLYIFGIYIKLFVAVYSEDQMKTMYESTARNFQVYTDETEKKILKDYSERGRFITIGYICMCLFFCVNSLDIIYMIQALMIFISLPLTPIFLDIIMPQDQPRPRMFILNGDYFVDNDVYYYQIYLFDSIACAATVFIMVSTDPMYAATVEHCLALFSICKYVLGDFFTVSLLCPSTSKTRSFSIVKFDILEIRISTKAYSMLLHFRYRLEIFNRNQNDNKTSITEKPRHDYAYYALKEAIILHKEILKYHEILQASYSLYFLLIMGATMGSVTMNSVMILMKTHNPFELIRYTLVLIGIMGQLFYLSWPGQKLIDYSSEIYRHIYLNDWYNSSLKCQNLLKFMTLRCTRPCTLTGGGIYVMNFINYAAVMYFVYNKRFQTALGVWPYQSRLKNAIICGFLLLVMIAIVVSQIIRLKKYIGKDKDKSMENVFILFYIFGIYIKLFTAVYAKERLKILYESTARNFQIYTDKMEKKILHEYSERGRLITLAFIIYMMTALIVFVLIPMYPIITDVIAPLDHPRVRMFILNGDYLVDRDEYYFQIYVFDSICGALTVLILCSTDPMYAAIVEHCLGLFCICKYRLKNFNKPRRTDIIEKANAESQVDEYAYTALVEAIQLHKNILKYTKIIQTSYSLYFLLEMGATMGLLTSISIIVDELTTLCHILLGMNFSVDRNETGSATGMHQIFSCLNWIVAAHILSELAGSEVDKRQRYHNDWYESSLRCQRLLRFMSLSCSKPCQLSGGGLYVMNFINFARVIFQPSRSLVSMSNALGVWPYQSREKNMIVCGLLLLLMLGMLLPQIVRLKKYAGKDSDKMLENIFILFYIFGIYIKLFTAVYAEKRLKVLYESTAKNFQIYCNDEAERRILYEYSERGRLLTLAFIVYMLPAVTVYVMLPMCPIIMDAAKPLDHPRYRMFILNGDYLVDEYDYYFYIYAFDSMAAIVTVAIMCATDPMYAAIVEHCLGLFSICKLRLKYFNKPNGTKAIEKTYYSETCGDDKPHSCNCSTDDYTDALFRYTEIMQASYSLYFLLEMGVTMGVVVCNSVIVGTHLSRHIIQNNVDMTLHLA
ncbi:hypothetical protein TSAR_003157 [Trichomalopsis sarcophagae]|uniref:Odorant receptor n=1 Tax=Trichomalopsis sarcophagae TaxID=543379 RepID=A0A232FBB5_9HYME|nr:hypothetical protein TSAR_003157 [Trichomalopsis sarcophagae]